MTAEIPKVIQSSAKQSRMEWIDALRGLAAVAVAVMHLYERLRGYYPSESFYQKRTTAGFLIYDFINLGKVGVVVFFLISGFVIPYSLYNKDLKQFAVSRFFRLYPAYWFSIALFVAITGVPPLLQLLANITMLQKFVGVADLIGVYWTLQIELIFYFICAILFRAGLIYNDSALKKAFYVFLGLSLIMALVRFFTEKKIPVAVPLGLDIMFLGMIWKRYTMGESVFTKKKMRAVVLLFIGTLLLVSFLAYNKDQGFEEAWYKYFASYSLAMLTFFCFYHFKWHNNLLLFLGRISYSLYLLHGVAIEIVDYLRKNYFSGLSSGVYIILFFAITLALSVSSYFFIEKPAITVGRHIIKAHQGKKRTALQ